MTNWKIKALEFVAKLWNLEVQIKAKSLKDVELHNMLVTYDVEHSLYRLLEYFKTNKETELQRELATLCYNLELSIDKEIEYYQYRQNVFKSDNKKLKLIEILKGIEHGKADCIYSSYWDGILRVLTDCGLIEENVAKDLCEKIEEIIYKKEQQNDN